MDSFNGYKLKPKDYLIQPNDIIIRVSNGGQTVTNNVIGIATGTTSVNTPLYPTWWAIHYEDWRAIETRPGSEAKTGDTVYCIEDTGGSCRQHDSFVVDKYTQDSKCIYPVKDSKLLSGSITNVGWSWEAKNFVVLITVDSQSEFPCFRKANIEKHIVKFTAPSKGTVVHVGDSSYSLHYSSNLWVEYDRTAVWTPCEDPSSQKADTASFIPFTIVDSKGNERTCVRLHKDNWYVSKNHNGNEVHHNPLFWVKKEKLKSDVEIANVTSSISPDPVTTVSVDSMINKPTQTKPNTKGKQMNSNLFTDMLKLLTQVEQTDLQKAPSAYAFFYNEDGKYEGTAKVANEAEAKALLQRPEHLGYTMRIYSFSDEFTTQIPVVSTIKKTVVAKSTDKPARKPRVSKAN